MKMAAQSEGQSDTGRAGGKTTSTIAPKIICGIGAAVTLAIMAAVMFNAPPHIQDPTVISTVQPAAETLIAPPASPPSAPIAIVGSNPVQQQTQSHAFNVPPAPAYAPDQPPAPSFAPDRSQQENQCFVLQRKFYFVGRGVIRVRAGGFVSEPVSLHALNPQGGVLPLLRPVAGARVEETIFIDGNAGLVVMTSDLPGFRQIWNNLHKTATFYVTWKPMRRC